MVPEQVLQTADVVHPSGASLGRLPDGRLHLQHGPIDLICEARGEAREVARAYRQAWERFQGVLAPLAARRDGLQTPVDRNPAESMAGEPEDATARRMMDAVRPFTGTFVTPMAAVAGAVADEVLAALVEGRELHRAYVNNGGDIALYLPPGAAFVAGVVSDLAHPEIRDRVTLPAEEPTRGLATSGWPGRSWSLGVADAVTVFAGSAAAADVAATLIANGVNVDDPAVLRTPAFRVFEEGDLGDLMVTTEVGNLDRCAVAAALDAGERVARNHFDAGRIYGALLYLKGERRMVGGLMLQQ